MYNRIRGYFTRLHNGLRRKAQGRWLRIASGITAAALLCVCAQSAMPAHASSVSDLQKQLETIQNRITQHKKELNDAKKQAQAAQSLQKDLEQQVSVIQSQIEVLRGEIAAVQNSIGIKEQEIDLKKLEIEQKQAEIDARWASFKQRMNAMQKLNDNGSVSMLGTVSDLYQLLTFSKVMQNISQQDTQIMDEMKAAKTELEQAQAELEQAKAELTARRNELSAQRAAMQSKQSELNASITEAKLDYEAARAAQAQAQAAIDSDEMDYEAVRGQIQKLIAQAAAQAQQLSFNGFICPLKSYSRISSEYGYRTNPVTGKYKLHGGIDFAAGRGTPIYAAAGGYVSVAGWSSGGYGNYVIIYHGQMKDGNNYSTLYGHMSSIAVKAGTYVSQGQVIGYVGSTGQSTGNHLHLEVWQGRSNASRINPRNCIPIPHK